MGNERKNPNPEDVPHFGERFSLSLFSELLLLRVWQTPQRQYSTQPYIMTLNQHHIIELGSLISPLSCTFAPVGTVCGGSGSAACLSHDQEGRKTLTLNMGRSRWKLLAWLSVLWGDERCHYLFMRPKCRAEEMGMADPESEGMGWVLASQSVSGCVWTLWKQLYQTVRT